MHRVRSVRSLTLLVLALGGTILPPTPADAQPPVVAYLPPVDAPIAEPFRAPAHPYGPGNRGIEYDTRPGEVVRAVADGSVVFAGQVGGTLHVTVLHADGVKTSYSYLQAVGVVAGQRVRQGDPVGTAGDLFQLGARRGGAYFDPSMLFRGHVTDVELLPFEVPAGQTPDQVEPHVLLGLSLDDGGGLGLHLPELGEAWDFILDKGKLAAHYLGELGVQPDILRTGLKITRRAFFGGACSDDPPPTRPVAGRDRVALTVGGLGSTSEDSSVDSLRTEELGYADARVVRFSYNGGRTPRTGDGLGRIPASSYGVADTQGDVRGHASRLADLVEVVAAERPEATVDVFGHSHGGVVIRLALLELERRGFDLGRLGLVATMGSPHKGADLATATRLLNATTTSTLVLDLVEAAVGAGIDPDAPAVAQLSETSDVIEQLDREGIPPGVEFLSIAARGDVVVAAPNSEVDGATNVIIGGRGLRAHSELVGSDDATHELRLALGGEPPKCEDVLEIIVDVTTGEIISEIEDMAALSVSGVAR